MVDVALVQVHIDDSESPQRRLSRVVDLVRGIVPAPDLVVLPELWQVGAFDTAAMQAHAEPLGGPWTQAMAQLAADTGVLLHAGSFPERHSGGVSNTSAVFSRDGELVASYRKIHLFGFDGGEAAALVAGQELVALETPLGRAGLATCYDLRFPGQFRQLSAAGAAVFLLPSGWPLSRIEHWALLTRARALENQAVLLGCNATGTSAGVPLGGRSLVAGPSGELLAEAGTNTEAVVRVTVPSDTAAAARSAFPVLRDRRID